MELAQKVGLKLEACAELESPIDRAEPEALQRVNEWMCAAEAQIAPAQLRMYCQLNAVGEATLRALIGRVLHKEKKEETDRDKIDFLMVQYFAQCAPMKLHRDDVKTSEVAAVLEILLGEVEPAAPAWLEPLGKAIDRLRVCKTLREMLDEKLLAEGRKIKIGANGRYFTPAVLIAFTRYNFIARRTFFRLVLTELDLLRADLFKLEKAGITTVDCRAAKLGEKETIAHLRTLVNDWKHPFRAEYSEGMTFEGVVALRDAVTKALASVPAKPVAKAVAAVTSRLTGAAGAAAARAVAPAVAPNQKAAVSTPAVSPTKPVAPAATVQARPNAAAAAAAQKATMPAQKPTAPVEKAVAASPTQAPAASAVPAPNEQAPFVVEEEFKAICAQLTESLVHSASAENTMTRITLGTQRLVLSSWEVRGFVSPNEQFSAAMQNGVTTRVLVERELEKAKAGARLEYMPELVKFAHAQAAMMQEHVAQARDARNIDAAVTLAATSKRLTQLLQEAGKFAAGSSK
jgi:hypothetical protein